MYIRFNVMLVIITKWTIEGHECIIQSLISAEDLQDINIA